MGTLSNLLRWKKPLELKDERGNRVLDDEGQPVTVWVRIINDKDLEDAFRQARIASAKIRAKLLDPTSDDYQALVEPFETATREQCYDMSLAGLGANWMGEALSTVVRPDLVKIDDIALDPDAPTLEEQEKLDARNDEQEETYREALQEFVETKNAEATEALDKLSDEELRNQAKLSVIITVPLETFLNQLEEAKMWRAVFLDEACTKRGFADIDDFRQTLSIIKEQIKATYDELEAGHSNIKN